MYDYIAPNTESPQHLVTLNKPIAVLFKPTRLTCSLHIHSYSFHYRVKRRKKCIKTVPESMRIVILLVHLMSEIVCLFKLVFA